MLTKHYLFPNALPKYLEHQNLKQCMVIVRVGVENDWKCSESIFQIIQNIPDLKYLNTKDSKCCFGGFFAKNKLFCNGE